MVPINAIPLPRSDASTRQRILELVLARPHYGVELARKLKIGNSTAYYHLDRLEREGMIRRETRGRWRFYRALHRP